LYGDEARYLIGAQDGRERLCRAVAHWPAVRAIAEAPAAAYRIAPLCRAVGKLLGDLHLGKPTVTAPRCLRRVRDLVRHFEQCQYREAGIPSGRACASISDAFRLILPAPGFDTLAACPARGGSRLARADRKRVEDSVHRR